jgi:acetate CoA/acetoacetate CoA-transferase alpha subunit
MIPDGPSLMIGGFMAVGTPERVVDKIVRQSKRNLTVIANDTASPEHGIGKLIAAKLVHKAIVSRIGLNPKPAQAEVVRGSFAAVLLDIEGLRIVKYLSGTGRRQK